MCSPAAAMAGAQVGQGVVSAQGAMKQGEMESNYYNYLANQNKEQSDAVDKASADNITSIKTQESKDLAKNKGQYEQLGASQKAVMAANGILVDSGSAQDIVDDTFHKQKLDEAAIRYNAGTSVIEQARSALNTKNQLSAEMASNQIRSSSAKAAAKINAASSIVSSATQAAGTYLSMSKYGNTKEDTGSSGSSSNMNSSSRVNKMSAGW